MNNGSRTEWSPIWSVIIRVIYRIVRPQSGSLIFFITSMITNRIGRQEGQSIKTMTKFEKETRYQLYVFIKTKKQQFTRRNARQQRPHMTHSVPSYRHDVLTVPFTVLLHCQIAGMTRILSCCAQVGRLLITKHVREFFYGFD